MAVKYYASIALSLAYFLAVALTGSHLIVKYVHVWWVNTFLPLWMLVIVAIIVAPAFIIENRRNKGKQRVDNSSGDQ